MTIEQRVPVDIVFDTDFAKAGYDNDYSHAQTLYTLLGKIINTSVIVTGAESLAYHYLKKIAEFDKDSALLGTIEMRYDSEIEYNKILVITKNGFIITVTLLFSDEKIIRFKEWFNSPERLIEKEDKGEQNEKV